MKRHKPSKSKQDTWVENMFSPPYPFKNLGLEQKWGWSLRGESTIPRSWNLNKLLLFCIRTCLTSLAFTEAGNHTCVFVSKKSLDLPARISFVPDQENPFSCPMILGSREVGSASKTHIPDLVEQFIHTQCQSKWGLNTSSHIKHKVKQTNKQK